MKKLLLIATLIFSFTNTVNAQEEKETMNLTVEFSGMKSDKGSLFVALYNNKTNFLKKGYRGEIAEIKNKKTVVVFKNLPKGVYAISAFHDANDNKKMDTNFFGIPKEPIGMSNDATGFMGPPKYKDSKFNVDSDKTISIKVN
ncbi:DUF2141 domain-containing protein [Polaribacter sp. SA4-12]|uniref:DUF2141 domain-containing protein n=1 Tax=Polaribacter sp. SA4-12 TaxID=1312072 RepID=UPI000B3C2105|nr:DUF2141 domain-containing protein [Polaribacter sp. SA4-12]ARV14997.1 hypothetical protein BTO07_07475 [Polaribacter sp. SA4-12]